MKFIDLHVHSMLSTGVDSQSRMLFQAKMLGTKIGFCDGKNSMRPSGIEIRPRNKSELKSALGNSNNFDYVIVHGGDEKINRLAVSDERVDVLVHPSRGRKDSGVDTFVARQAKTNNVAIEVNIKDLISVKMGQRVNAFKNVEKNLMLSRKYGFNLIAASGARSRLELRSGDGVSQVLKLLGFSGAEVESAMQNVPKNIIKGE